VKSRFQSLPFKCNLQRYTAVSTSFCATETTSTRWARTSSRIQLTHSLKGAWFQSLLSNLKCDFLVSKFAFNKFFNLFRYNEDGVPRSYVEKLAKIDVVAADIVPVGLYKLNPVLPVARKRLVGFNP
jgi:hypothetical protein